MIRKDLVKAFERAKDTGRHECEVVAGDFALLLQENRDMAKVSIPITVATIMRSCRWNFACMDFNHRAFEMNQRHRSGNVVWATQDR